MSFALRYWPLASRGQPDRRRRAVVWGRTSV